MQAELSILISMDYIILILSNVDDARKFAWKGPFRDAVHVGLDCSRDMEHTVQVLAVHCVLKQSSDILASLHLARTCHFNR